jgi:hypothetical protein
MLILLWYFLDDLKEVKNTTLFSSVYVYYFIVLVSIRLLHAIHIYIGEYGEHASILNFKFVAQPRKVN